MSLLVAEKKYWQDALIRLVSIIQSLAERNLALTGSSKTLYEQNNGNFEMELLAKFDPVMKQRSDSSYLGYIIENELIASISGEMLDAMVTEIKQPRY